MQVEVVVVVPVSEICTSPEALPASRSSMFLPARRPPWPRPRRCRRSSTDGSMLGERSIVEVRPCLPDTSSALRSSFGIWSSRLQGVIWVGLNKAKFEKIAIASSSRFATPPSAAGVAQLRHRNQQAYLSR